MASDAGAVFLRVRTGFLISLTILKELVYPK